MLGGIGMPELITVLIIIMIIFGAGKLPEIGSGLGKAIREFKKGVNEADSIDNIEDGAASKKDSK